MKKNLDKKKIELLALYVVVKVYQKSTTYSVFLIHTCYIRINFKDFLSNIFFFYRIFNPCKYHYLYILQFCD